MGKNINMLKVFAKVLLKNEKAIKEITPNAYAKDIYSIDYKCLKKKGYKNIIFDIDNTIMPVDDIEVTDELINFINSLKEDFQVYLISNNKEARVRPVGEKLEVLYNYEACKPKKEAYTKLIKEKDFDKTIAVGDQLLSDIVGGNRLNLYTILVEPVSNHYNIQTGTSRILQNLLVKRLKK